MEIEIGTRLYDEQGSEVSWGARKDGGRAVQLADADTMMHRACLLTHETCLDKTNNFC